jgi:hypothetical protein
MCERELCVRRVVTVGGAFDKVLIRLASAHCGQIAVSDSLLVGDSLWGMGHLSHLFDFLERQRAAEVSSS